MNSQTLSSHFVERFAERVLKVEQKDVKSVAHSEVQEVVKDLELKYVVTANYHDQKEAIFYLCEINNEQHIIVANQSNQSFITIYKVDYGISESLNGVITSSIMDSISVERENLEEVEENFKNEIESVDCRIINNNMLIESIQAQLDALKRETNSLEQLKKDMNSEIVLQNEKIKQIAYKMIYSINYNLQKMKK